MSDYELPESRLGTTDESGKRVYVHPHDLKGKWKNRRKTIYWLLIAIYLVLPWIYFNGRQIIRLDLPAREFYFFGNMFYGHDGPFLIYLLLAFVFFISFITTVYGRVWCGYACPQTVFIDAIYRQIERFIEGTGAKRDKLERSSWTKEKILKRSLKWLCYILVSMHIVHSGIGYFVGTRELFYITTQNPLSNLYLFTLMLSLTLIILLDFGWFREQFCIIACPYGRFQSLVMDENSLVISYDKKRGEPRKRTKQAQDYGQGDCVNCNRCVNVCPTGIDIRDGLQMECIACTMCIDACDDIMRRVNKPEGLISYSTENTQDGKKHKRSLRVYIYLALFLVTCFALVGSLSNRHNLKAQIIRSGRLPYQLIKAEDRVLNHFKIKLRYMNSHQVKLKMKLGSEDVNLVSTEDIISLKDNNFTVDIFLKFKPTLLQNGEKRIDINFYDIETKEIVLKKELVLVGPL